MTPFQMENWPSLHVQNKKERDNQGASNPFFSQEYFTPPTGDMKEPLP